MLKTGILNPGLNHLLSRIRHTNTLVISDLGFPFWPQIETVDLSLVAGVPTVPQVLEAIMANFHVGKAWMAKEFLTSNPAGSDDRVCALLGAAPIEFESHVDFKRRVPAAIGLVRTGDPTPYHNIIIESA